MATYLVGKDDPHVSCGRLVVLEHIDLHMLDLGQACPVSLLIGVEGE